MARSARIPLAGAALAVAGIVLGRLLAFEVGPLHRADALTLHGFMSLDRPSVHALATAVAHVADPAPYGLLGAVLIGVALIRGRPRVAAAVACVLLGAAFTTDYVLKPALAAPRFAAELGFRQVPSGSFPSGHATASMALALCAILVAAPAFRPYVAALGAGFAIAVSFAFLALGWHYPSDVLGGYLVAGAWTGAAVGVLRLADARWPAHSGRQAAGRVISRVHLKTATLLAAVAGIGCIAVVAAFASGRAIDFLRVHTAFAVGAAAIAVTSVIVAGVLAAILRD